MMAVYQKGTYTLWDHHGNETGRLIDEKGFAKRSQIQTKDDKIDFVKHGFFASTRIIRNGLDIGEVNFIWNSILFKLELDSRILQFRLCQKNFWGSAFKVINEQKEEVIIVEPKFRWHKMHYDYQLKVPSHPSKPVRPCLLLMAVYGVSRMQHHAS